MSVQRHGRRNIITPRRAVVAGLIALWALFVVAYLMHGLFGIQAAHVLIAAAVATAAVALCQWVDWVVRRRTVQTWSRLEDAVDALRRQIRNDIRSMPIPTTYVTVGNSFDAEMRALAMLGARDATGDVHLAMGREE